MPRWLSWLKNSVSKQSQAYINKHTMYQACKYESNVSMHDINTSKGERERAIANTRDLFRGSSTLALHPRLDTRRIFTINRSHRITRCRNTYKLSDSLVRTQRKPTSSPRTHLKPRVHTRTLNHCEHTCPPPQRTKKRSLVITTL